MTREEAIHKGITVSEIKHSMKRRSPWHDYRQVGTYMLTLVLSDRKPLFGEIVVNLQTDSIQVTLSPLAIAIRDYEIPKVHAHYPMVEIWKACFMPDHLHIILRVSEPLPQGKHLGHIVAGFKYGCSCRATELLGTVASIPMSSTVATVPLSSAQGLFETGYNDKILLHEGQLTNWKNYLDDNPKRLYIKRTHPDLFRIRRHISLCGMQFSALGNPFLIDYPDKQVIECSRFLSLESIQQQTEQALLRAEQGAVTITAGISEGEKYIAKIIREAGYPLVIILKDGFPAEGSDMEKYFKPQGIYFETCANGKLLLLEATEDTFCLPSIQQATERTLRNKAEMKHLDYTPIPTTSLRYRFVAQNEMAKLLTNP